MANQKHILSRMAGRARPGEALICSHQSYLEILSTWFYVYTDPEVDEYRLYREYTIWWFV